MSYKDYSISNIQEIGMGEILWLRALKFFRLHNEGEEGREKMKEKIKKRLHPKRLFKKTAQTILYPVYILILLLSNKRGQKRVPPKRSVNKYVKNSYIE